MSDIKLHQGDCLEVMKQIPDGSVDLILTDPPYGTTACKWDTVIPFEPMWKELKRIIKPNGAIALFGSEPFSSALRMSNIKEFKYDWVWDKVSVSNPQLAKIQPLKNFENIMIFGEKAVKYFPQGLIRTMNEERIKKGFSGDANGNEKLGHIQRRSDYVQEFENYPKAIIKFSRPSNAMHPTQKPVNLLRNLIETYTLENETVLDFTMGSGSTGVACKQLNRKFIGIELDEQYFKIAEDRINGELL